MSTPDVVVVAEWIKQIAAEERKRDAMRVLEEESIARKADLVRLHGQRLIDELHVAVKRDVEAFEHEFAGERAHAVVFEASPSDGGFIVRREGPSAVSLHVDPRLEAASMACHYRFPTANGLPPREVRLELAFAGNEGSILQIKHHGTGQVFHTADTLSEFLLVPVFTGRPR
jgi:hypothetical protein